MNNEKISSLGLIAELSQQTGMPKKATTAFIKQLEETIHEALLKDGIVKIKGFGTFKIAWHESRESVNVQTGERYEIAGHNKVTFIPDDELKNIVNTPYAHLMTVDMDGNEIKKPQPDAPEEDPRMKRFSEQAEEILSLISGMQDLKPEKTAKTPVVVIDEQPAAIIPEKPSADSFQNTEIQHNEEIPEVAETSDTDIKNKGTEKVVIKEEAPVKQPVIVKKEFITNTATTPQPEDITENELVERMEAHSVKKKKAWLYILLIIIAAAILGVGVWYCITRYYVPASNPSGVMENPASLPAAPVQSSDSAKKTGQPVQAEKPVAAAASASQSADGQRIYREFITTEITTQGSRLTLMALKYYGHKVFWVYIYEANKTKIPNPAIIPVGTKINIPKLGDDLINLHNPKCLQNASKLQTHYLSLTQQ
jgi:nucleoid DNA-binding protein